MTVESSSSSSGSTVMSSATASLNPLAIKTKEEILTQLHLIKDIRRLETYQRDFFLKVKESLHQVQQLLDKQLMDVAWSDALLTTEETLLKASVRLSNASPSQISELFNLISMDKEKLSQRFNELSVKSSLSEFVVNSRQPLDVDTVHRATEAILRNDKPKQPTGDKSIPFDHTFFLANFCMTTIASSTFASSSKTNKETLQQQYYASSSMDPALSKQQRSIMSANAAAATAPTPSPYYNGLPNNVVVANNTSSNASANEGLVDQFTSSRQELTQSVATNAPSSSLIGHELVSAISQIAGQQQPQQQVGIMNNPNASGNAAIKIAANKGNQGGLGNGISASALYGPARGNKPSVSPSPLDNSGQKAIVISQEQSSDSVGSECPESNEVAAVTAFDSNKPLSFARIASLHLNGQQHLTNGLNTTASNKTLITTNQLQEQQTAGVVHSTNNLNLGSDLSLSYNREPRYFFDLTLYSKPLGRVIIAVCEDAAPRMARNFALLATNERGFGYRGCTFFQAWKGESVITGDWEHNSGRGGRAALESGPLFTPDDTKLPCVRGAVGMRRMSKKHSSLNQVASQFRIILANMNSQFTGIFGHVVFGIEALDKVADMGGDGGRPERTASIVNCGLYKS